MSVLRTLQYEKLAHCHFPGKTLDIGGGDHADYHNIVKFTQYESINIDPEIKPTWVIGVDDAFPVADQSYDTVLSLNTFEHIYDVHNVIREIWRALKPGGEFIASVPFLYPIHGHPNDFFRPTPGWWNESLKAAGFNSIEIEPLAWGPFSTGLSCSGMPGPFKRARLHISLLMDVFYTRVRRERSQSNGVLTFSVGFFVKAKKPT
jgi:SAM-dependent methyltransferase